MKNLFKSEIYKLRISSAFRFFAICVLASAIVGVLVVQMLGDVIGEIPQELLDRTITDGMYNFGVIQFHDTSELQNIDSGIVISFAFRNLFPLVFVAIFISLYVIKEFEYGGIRNFFLKGFSRKRVFISKYAVLMGAVAATICVYFFGYCIATVFIFGMPGTDNINIARILAFLAIQIFLYISFASICFMLAILIRRNLVIFINASMVVMGTMTLNMIMVLTNGQLDLSTYWILTYIAKQTPTDINYIFLAVGTITLTVSTVLAIKKFEYIELK
ncbi:MAG: ABC transporter permease [Oscillospiraceae bacterium]|jgi:ABC-type transport system involved in multi-copper enzyme maturation permease subunit|nr:ABC transporter permease [Oscillospiraceae bacterium]